MKRLHLHPILMLLIFWSMLAIPTLLNAEVLPDVPTTVLRSGSDSLRNVGIDWEIVRRGTRDGGVTQLQRSYPVDSSAAQISVDEAKTTALSFIESHRSSLGLSDAVQIMIRDVAINKYDTSMFAGRTLDYVVGYVPTYGGYPLYGSNCRIVMNHAGQIYFVRHFAPDGQSLPSAHVKDEAAAVSIAASRFGATSITLTAPPRIFAMMPDRLVWEVSVSRPYDATLTIDANSGEIIAEHTNVVEQVPAGQFWLHGQIEGSADGVGNFTGLPRVSVSIVDDDVFLPDTLWQGESDDTGNYNSVSPQYFPVWEDPFHINVVDAFARADMSCEEVRVERFVLNGTPELISISSPVFNPGDQGEYAENVRFGDAIQSEAACAFREILRGHGTSWGHLPKNDQIAVEVNNDGGARTNGTRIFLPPGSARLPGDTMLHEYGHTIMFERFGNMWIWNHTDDDGGHPGQCPNDCAHCSNHMAANNECSADAILEGWASFYAVAAYNANPSPYAPADHTYNWPGSTSSWDLEDNSFTFVDGAGTFHANNNGDRDEFVVASILWDLFDNSGAQEADRLFLGGAQVWNLMMNLQPYTTKELYEMAYVTFPESRQELWEIFHAHGLDDGDPILQAPTQLVPTAGSQYAYPAPVLLTWSTVVDPNFGDVNQSQASGSYYEVQLSMSPDFTSVMIDEEVGINSLSVNLQPGTYHFRVRARDYAGNTPGPWSSSSHFSVAEYLVTATMDFEDGVDGTVIRSTIPGMYFTTTQGYDWLYGDVRTGHYNVDPYGQYVCNGDFFAWLGPNQGMGRIDFTGATARNISLKTSTYSGLYLDAYNPQNVLIDRAYCAGNLGTYQLSTLSVSGEEIAYILIHDSGNYWLIDDLQVEDMLRMTEQMLGDNYQIGTEALDLIDIDQSVTYRYTNNGSASLQLILNWGGSEFQLTAIKPDGAVFDQWQTDQPPLIAMIDEPMNGEWTFRITAVDIPSNDYPFAFVLGATVEVPDATAPSITIMSPVNGMSYGSQTGITFDYGAADQESGIREVVGILDQATVVMPGQTLTISTTGEHHFSVTAVNYLGMSTADSISFNVLDLPAGCLWADATSGPLGDTIDGHGVSWGDYDGDGDDDLFLANNGPNRLLRNDGGGNYVKLDVSLGGEGDSRAGCWGDYDNDGDLDLYVVNFGTANALYRNDGGEFVEATAGPLGDPGQNTSGVWADWDLDGDVDLYLTCDDGRSKLLRNDGGTFTDLVGDPASFVGWSRGCAFGDYDNDGDPDLYVTIKDGPNKLFRNDRAAGLRTYRHRPWISPPAARAAPGATTTTTAGWTCMS